MIDLISAPDSIPFESHPDLRPQRYDGADSSVLRGEFANRQKKPPNARCVIARVGAADLVYVVDQHKDKPSGLFGKHISEGGDEPVLGHCCVLDPGAKINIGEESADGYQHLARLLDQVIAALASLLGG